MSDPIIFDPNGRQAKSQKYSPCPKCGSGPDKRIPSGGFGETYLVCITCGYEFKELKCPTVIP